MTASAGFILDPQVERPKVRSRFGAKPTSNGPKRIALEEISNKNEVGYGSCEIRPQSRPPVQYQQQQQMFRFPPKNEDPYGPIEIMHPADPPQKFKGFKFTPSNEINFDDEIELEPLPIRGETNWF